LRVPVDLALLRDGFQQLAQTPYFDRRLNRVADDIVGAIDASASQSPTLDEHTLRFFGNALWHAHKYLAGSTISESPYEIEYCLRTALSDWVHDECVVATTLRTELDFHFWLPDIGKVIDNLITSYKRQSTVTLIPIALPRLYKNRPLYCTPLYHELGHFIDRRFGITDLSIVRFPPSSGANIDIERSHRSEHFADLFAAQYVGSVAAQTLHQIANGHAASPSHPATTDRILKIQAFLNGTSDISISQINAVLTQIGLSQLSVRHSQPVVAEAFDDIRPCAVGNASELHGLFPACWAYLDQVHSGANAAWASRGRAFPEVDTVVNDLLEKSIRNHSIVEKWSAATI
jgi:hypothetical protein